MSSDNPKTNKKPSLTTRRGFIGVLGLSSLSLAGLWTGYGAMKAGHAHGGQLMSVEQFQQITDDFIQSNLQDDGAVMPPMINQEMANMPGHHSRSEVYMTAFKWGFAPNLIRLKANHPYRFRMMSTDVTHGASINLGTGSLMIRLPHGTIVDNELTISEPGEYLIYCSYYCGIAHDHMKATLIVEPS